MSVVRELEEADLDVAAELYVRVFNAEPWNDAWSREDARARLAALLGAPGGVGLLAEDDGTAVGLAVGRVERWYDAEHFRLEEMAVDASHQRTGVGSALVDALGRRLPEVARWYLLTARDSPAEAFYAKHGFAPAGRVGLMVRRGSAAG